MYPRHALMALPMIRKEVPGWGKIAQMFGVCGGENDRRWRDAPHKVVRGKVHGYWMELSLTNFSERLTYFLGRYHELWSILLMDQCIRPGERVVDVGANIGMLSLHAARLVGPDGVVEAFEPNPTCARRFHQAIERNKIHQINLHPLALADEPGTFTLKVPSHYTGSGTLASVGNETSITDTYDVSVTTGDDVLLQRDMPISFIKIDIEGYEAKALRGMKTVLAKWRPIVTTEADPSLLQRAGSSIDQLHELMRDLGYRGYGLETRRSGVRHHLHLCDSTPGHTDIVWIHLDGPFSDRVKSYIH